MDGTTVLLVAAAGLVAYANGANDNFKGVATLFGSRTTGYRTALTWATATTLLGSLAAVMVSHGLVAAFRGKGIVPDLLTHDAAFLASVGLGSGGTVLLASRIGIPISTTHALLGGLVGAGLLATSGAIGGGALAANFVLPLLASPFLAVGITASAYPLLRSARRRLGVERRMCLCEGTRVEPVVRALDGALLLRSSGAILTVGQTRRCEERYLGRVLGIDAQRILDVVHFLSAGLVGFARGANDAPKIAALLVGSGSPDRERRSGAWPPPWLWAGGSAPGAWRRR
jgi:PiT family inorganic phosphate transporter